MYNAAQRAAGRSAMVAGALVTRYRWRYRRCQDGIVSVHWEQRDLPVVHAADNANSVMITHVVEEIEHVYETVEACKDCAEDLRDAYVCLKRLNKVQPDHVPIVYE